MKHISIRYLIGLGDPSGSLSKMERLDTFAKIEHQARRKEAAHRLLTAAYDVGSFFYGAGTWKGEGEPSMMFETIQPDDERERERARAIGREIRAELEQEAVGLVFTPVDFELV